MKRRFRNILTVCIAVILTIAALFMFQASAVTQSEIDALKKQQQTSQEKQKQLKEQLASVKEDQAAAQQKRKILVQQLDAINGEIANIDAQITWYDHEIAKKETEHKEAEAREAEQYQRFCQRVRAMEEEGTVSYWSILFKAESFTDLLDRISDIGAVMDYDNAVMDQLIATREELERLQNELKSARADEQTARDQQVAKRAEQQNKVAEAQVLLAQINADVEEVNRQLDAEDAAAADIQAQITKKQKQLEEQRKQQHVTLPPTGSSYNWPLPGRNLTLTSAFGYRIHPITGRAHSHTGLDIAAAGGTPIYAAKGGQVVTSEYHYSYGNYVVIDHGNGNSTLYAHMSKRAVSEGQMVTQGQTIGYVGNTGSSKGNHLHLEVRVGGRRTDPEKCFPGLYNSFVRAYNW